MANVEWALVCENVEIDALGYLTAKRIFSTLSTELPVAANLTLVCRITAASDADVSLAVRVERPDGTVIGQPQTATQRMPKALLIDATMQLRDLPLDQVGVYLFHVVLDGTVTKTVPIQVINRPSTVH